jgi:hypothetical protein
MKFVFAMTLARLISAQSQACFHYDKNFNGKLNESRKEVFLFHDGQEAHMVIRTNLSAKKFPKEIAWVLPFPSMPTKMEEVDGPIFEEISGLMPSSKLMIGRAFGKGAGPDLAGSAIKVHDTVILSNYVIQPIEITKDGSTSEFNAWLAKNKFNPMPLENQKYYLKKGAVFLAIRMNMNRPTEASLRSRPLHVAYKSDEVSVPIKFSHDSRKFDLDLYVFSKRELKKDLGKMYLNIADSVTYKNERLNPMMDNLIGGVSGYLTHYKATELNADGKSLKALAQDPSFSKAELGI